MSEWSVRAHEYAGREVGVLGRGEAPLGSPWRCPCDEQEEALRLKMGGDLHPARPDWWPPTKRPRASTGGLIAQPDVLVTTGACALVLAHLPSFGRNPRG